MKPRLSIKEPCKESWAEMRIGLHSRFCNNCQKNVIDFTGKSREEILEILFNRNGEKNTCGRFNKSQLDFSNSNLIVTINAFDKRNRNQNLTFYLLTISALILASCDSNAENRSGLSSSFQSKEVFEAIIEDSIENHFFVSKNDSTVKKNDCEIDEPLLPTIVELPVELTEITMGEVIFDPDSFTKNSCLFPVESMPEFKGGVDSLLSYLTKNINYPEWEKEQNIEGKVIASFIIDEMGKVTQLRITKSVEGSKNFNKEVLRVVSEMPDWVPGKRKGKNVAVHFNLPINFQL